MWEVKPGDALIHIYYTNWRFVSVPNWVRDSRLLYHSQLWLLYYQISLRSKILANMSTRLNGSLPQTKKSNFIILWVQSSVHFRIILIKVGWFQSQILEKYELINMLCNDVVNAPRAFDLMAWFDLIFWSYGSYSWMESQKLYADTLAHRAEENPVCTHRDILNTV